MPRTCILLIALTFTLMPTVATAQSNGDGLIAEQIDAVINLLDSFGASETVIDTVRTALDGGTPGSDCRAPAFTQTMTRGSNGSGVTELQRFLKRKSHFTYPEITGYFGPVTQKAVQAYQAENDIVSSGTPGSTGYGVVGPKTRAAFRTACGENQVSLSVSPASGEAPLDVDIQTSVSVGEDGYTLVYGDGQKHSGLGDCPANADCLSPIVNSHTYAAAGEYTITLKRYGEVVATTSVTVTQAQEKYDVADIDNVSVSEEEKDEYAESWDKTYTITLKDGTTHRASATVGNVTEDGYRQELRTSLRDTGYVGTLDALLQRANNGDTSR